MCEKKLFLCRSYYHIFISLNILINSESKGTIICVDSELKTEEIKKMRSKINVLFEGIELELITNSKKSYNEILNSNFYEEIYFFHWVIYKKPEYDFYRVFRKKGINLIEDGTTHYGVYQNDVKTKKKYVKSIVNLMLFGKQDFVLNNNVKQVLATYPEKFPSFVNWKISNLVLSDLKDTEKNKIIKLFGLEDFKVIIPEQKMVIIFTQPLSEDGYLVETEKISLYSDIVTKYTRENYKVFFKQHPREKTTYNFDDVVIVKKDFPGEVLNYLDLDFDKAIAVCSGVIDNIKATEKIQLYPDFFSTYKKMN
ncbi:polysialyltransferase family glycosyltransferase [Planococcus alpniumensis]|uniref:polysialyltransferase family glycosyltransferase n=1 Tax=Planococcus alpniumensis TaxID=2708345 RepID=UPI001B8B1B62|nr:polysialyltransferase family glycosyltransferase [Planococcus sp. MSAK28401]